MRTILVVLSVVMLASGASAGIDPGADSFGVYFDTAGNTNCTTAPAMQPLEAYLILMNPTGPTDGFECTVDLAGAPRFVLSIDFCNSTVCDGDACGPYSFAIGCPSAYPLPENGALVLATWLLMLQVPSELLFRVGPAAIPSLPGGLPVVTGNGVLRRCQVASGDVNLPVAGINAGADCVVGDETDSFGAVKSLFR